MPFSGAGLFTRVHNFVTDKANAIKIIASRVDAEFDGVATGLSNTITRDGQSTIIADIPMHEKKLTRLADAVADADAMNKQSVVALLAYQVSMSRFLRALEASGAGRVATVEAALSDAPGDTTRLAWRYVPYVITGDIVSNFVASTLSLSTAQMDSVFTAARALSD